MAGGESADLSMLNVTGGHSGTLTFNGGTLEATASFSTARGTTIHLHGHVWQRQRDRPRGLILDE